MPQKVMTVGSCLPKILPFLKQFLSKLLNRVVLGNNINKHFTFS